ncbi:MAG: Patatin [Geminicoccaceae bacterium]|nr:Patatin [Geminicoccaceae bacterium]
MALQDKLTGTGPKKLLALDGGGIRGVIALEVLARVEELLGRGDPRFRLADYFDLIAGTSTGAIIAAGLSLRMSVNEIRRFYLGSGAEMFDRARLLRRYTHYRFEHEKLAGKLKAEFGADTRLGSDRLQTLLVLVMRNATTDSPWPLSNNPYAKYNDRERADCNLNLPLWQLVRASTAAPVYFPPEVVTIGRRDFVFVDGGITTYNNPAFLAFLMATVQAYWIASPPEVTWPAATGTDKLLVLSVGTGAAADANAELAPDRMNLLFNAGRIPSALMYAALTEQDVLCRVFGDCLMGDVIDSELKDLIGEGGRGPVERKLFTYVRYTADLSRKGLDDLGLRHARPEEVQKLDSVDAIPQMREVGRAVAARKVQAEHFARFPA